MTEERERYPWEKIHDALLADKTQPWVVGVMISKLATKAGKQGMWLNTRNGRDINYMAVNAVNRAWENKILRRVNEQT